MQVKKVLILRFSSIGDIVLTSPIVRCVKQQLNCDVHFATKKIYTSFLTTNPNIDKVFSFDKSVTEITRKLRNENYDFVVDLHKNIRSKRLVRSLGIPSVSFDKLNIKKWLLVNFKINRLPKIHIVDRYFEAVKPIGVINDNKGLDFVIPEDAKVNLEVSNYVCIAIGAQNATKKLPKEKLVSICNKITKPIVLIGGKEDSEIGDYISQNSTSYVLNTCGKYSVNQSASIIQNSCCVITHDTGMMHIAAALNKKTISVWGNTVPEFGMYSYQPQNPENFKNIEVKNLSCRPCSKIGYSKCPKGHFKCMNDIDEKEIIELIEQGF